MHVTVTLEGGPLDGQACQVYPGQDTVMLPIPEQASIEDVRRRLRSGQLAPQKIPFQSVRYHRETVTDWRSGMLEPRRLYRWRYDPELSARTE